MAETTADVLIDTIHDWGVEVIFGLPGDGINGIMEALRKRAGPDPLHPGAPRGVGRLHGVRLRQVHRQAGRLPGHLRTRRHPPAQRPLRRQARRPAGAGDHRHALSRPDRHPHAAGRRARQALRRRRRLQRARHGADPRRERRRPRVPHGAGLSRRRPHHVPGRPAGDAGRAQGLASATCRTTPPTSFARGAPAAGRRRPRRGGRRS